jgi:hypothetical protein
MWGIQNRVLRIVINRESWKGRCPSIKPLRQGRNGDCAESNCGCAIICTLSTFFLFLNHRLSSGAQQLTMITSPSIIATTLGQPIY